MLRDKALVPLSQQHQHALALCVRIERGLAEDPGKLDLWQAEAAESYEREISSHFEVEERTLFPAAKRFSALAPLVEELIGEHRQLRKHFANAMRRTMDRTDLGAFVELLSSHIRKEERQLFEELQRLMTASDLADLGNAMERAEARAQGRPPHT